jgi:hypothetical protein
VGLGDLVGGHRQGLRASEAKRLPKLTVPNRVKRLHLF